MVNESKVNDPRFWKKWEESGAVGTMEDAINTAAYGRKTASKLKRYDCKNQTLEGIDKALQDGLVVRAFRSGGGLRVVRIEDFHNGPLKGYGDHPNLMPALRRASKDYLEGGKPYECVYLTGTTKAEDNMDWWVLGGHTLWAEKSDGKIKVEARDYNYKPIVSVIGDNFQSAYGSLCERVTKDTFERARGF